VATNSAWVVGGERARGIATFLPVFVNGVVALPHPRTVKASPWGTIGRATFSPAHCARMILSGGLFCGDFVGDGRMNVKCSNGGFGLEKVP
jgi:hypothetical protein